MAAKKKAATKRVTRKATKKATAPDPAVPVVVVPPIPEPTAELEPEPAVRVPEPPKASKPPRKGLPPEQEIKELQKRIASDEARIRELEHPLVEYPKMVKHRKDTGPTLTFNSRAEQDAAGPDYADL